MKALFTLFIIGGTLFELTTAKAQQYGGQYNRAYHHTLRQLANTRSDYQKKQSIIQFTQNNGFNTQEFITLVSHLTSDYYRFETAKIAMCFVSTPLTFDRVSNTLRSLYYQRELLKFIHNSPRYKSQRNQPTRGYNRRPNGRREVVVVKQRGSCRTGHGHGYRRR